MFMNLSGQGPALTAKDEQGGACITELCIVCYTAGMSFDSIILSIIVTIYGLFSLQMDLTPPVTQPLVVTAEVTSVVDGDTIDVLLDGREERVRYIGIDTPEYNNGEAECFAEEATNANEVLVSGALVRLEADQENRDRFGRLLRYVYVDGLLINEELVRNGYATTLTIPPNTQKKDQLAAREAEAQRLERGLWQNCR